MARLAVALALVLAVAAAAPVARAAPPYVFRQLGSFEWRQSAFTFADVYRGEPALFITSFGARDDTVAVVERVGQQLGNVAGIKPAVVTNGIIWPNEALTIPEAVFGRKDLLLVCGGFFAVPGKKTGAVVLIDTSNGTSVLYKISTDETDFFYHMAEWHDMNGDGRLDLITAKGRFPTFGQPEGKLVWLENPGTLRPGQAWRETFLIDGPDVFFRLHDFDDDGKDDIVATQFFTARLTYLWNVGVYGAAADWRSRVIADNIGSPFDVRITDLNNDGRLDLLVTNHENVALESAVYAFEVPADPRTGTFTRHLLANDFETLQPGTGQASPGSAQAFFPILNETEYKPHIVVSGDGAQKAYLLRPTSEDPANWSYQKSVIIDVKNTVGGISVSDTDRDGAAELFIPEYDGGRVHIVTFGV